MLDARNKYFSKLAGTNGQSSGTYKAYWAFTQSIDRQTEELELSDSLWNTEVKDFVEALRKGGIKSFVVTDHSTGLMENIWLLTENGCTLDGPCIVRRAETPYEDAELIKGLRFTLD